ncbi:MAG: hypothetical protein ACRCVN_04730, partial [Spirochaetia bacterium]
EDSPSYLYSRMIALSYCYMELLKRKTGDDNGGDRECSVCKKKINLEEQLLRVRNLFDFNTQLFVSLNFCSQGCWWVEPDSSDDQQV